MDTGETIAIPKLEGNTLTWFPLPTGVTYKNVGMNAELGFTKTGVAPTVFKGELFLQGETVDALRGDAYVLQDSRFSYEFIPIA